MEKKEIKKILIDGIVKSQYDNKYNFNLRFDDEKDAQYWKDIINQILQQCGIQTEIQTAYFDAEEMKNHVMP